MPLRLGADVQALLRRELILANVTRRLEVRMPCLATDLVLKAVRRRALPWSAG